MGFDWQVGLDAAVRGPCVCVGGVGEGWGFRRGILELKPERLIGFRAAFQRRLGRIFSSHYGNNLGDPAAGTPCSQLLADLYTT